MSGREKLCQAVRLIAWGHILLYLHFNLETIDILPDWLGYVLMLRALPALSEEESSANLLKPLGIALAVWEGFMWIAALLGIDTSVGVVTVISYVITVVSMYFHFQLLTNLASAAEKYNCEHSGKILLLRTVNTILILVLALPFPWDKAEAATIILLVAMAIVTIWKCFVLFSVKKELEGMISE